MKLGEILFEMSNLKPTDTGLPFTVFVSPRGRAKHDVRVKVTNPPWGAHPEGIYGLRPSVHFEEGEDWLSRRQQVLLNQWAQMNMQALVDFWEERIIYDDDLKERLVSVGDAPPGDYRQAVAALRAIAPKVRMIRWFDQSYHLIFNRYAPRPEKVTARFQQLCFQPHPITVQVTDPAKGVVLWSAGT
jgi:hypothetical protein